MIYYKWLLRCSPFISWPADDRLRQLERRATEVVPAVREQVKKARGQS
jgi:hypothetical protein